MLLQMIPHRPFTRKPQDVQQVRLGTQVDKLCNELRYITDCSVESVSKAEGANDIITLTNRVYPT